MPFETGLVEGVAGLERGNIVAGVKTLPVSSPDLIPERIKALMALASSSLQEARRQVTTNYRSPNPLSEELHRWENEIDVMIKRMR